LNAKKIVAKTFKNMLMQKTILKFCSTIASNRLHKVQTNKNMKNLGKRLTNAKNLQYLRGKNELKYTMRKIYKIQKII